MPSQPFPLTALLLAATALVTSSCDQGTTTPAPRITISAVAGSDGQSTVTGATLPSPLRVLVLEDGAPKSNVSIRWETLTGSMTPVTSQTDANGIAAAQWKLGSTPGSMSATASLADAEGSPVTFHAAALFRPGMMASIAGGNLQTGPVATQLPIPLRVRVETFNPSDAGVTVTWHTSSGQVSNPVSTTDAQGFAETSWVLGTVALDTQVVEARISGAEGSPLRFKAFGYPGPAFKLSVPSVLDTATAFVGAAYTTQIPPFEVRLYDQYGNALADAPVTWSVVDGPVHIEWTEDGDLTNYQGFTRAHVAGDAGAAGSATVRVSVDGTTLTRDFGISLVPAKFVALRTSPYMHFISGSNGSYPAVDTIPVGGTMTWFLDERFDYETFAVAPLGHEAFSLFVLPYGASGAVSVTFDEPGVYQYWGGLIYDDWVVATLVVQ